MNGTLKSDNDNAHQGILDVNKDPVSLYQTSNLSGIYDYIFADKFRETDSHGRRVFRPLSLHIIRIQFEAGSKISKWVLHCKCYDFHPFPHPCSNIPSSELAETRRQIRIDKYVVKDPQPYDDIGLERPPSTLAASIMRWAGDPISDSSLFDVALGREA